MKLDAYGLLDMSATDFLGESVAILGIRGSGKSNTAAVLMEELLLAGVPILAVDPDGEYHTLREINDEITVVGKSREADVVDVLLTPDNAGLVCTTAYQAGKSVVLDISGYGRSEREYIIFSYFQPLWDLAGKLAIPLVVFLEEAHNWIPQRSSTTVTEMFTTMAAEGRKRGIFLVIIGQRSSRIDKDVLTQSDICFLHRVRHPQDLRVYYDLVPRERKQIRDMVARLKPGDALVLRGDSVIRYRMRARASTHVGATPTLDDIPKNTQMSLLDLLASGK